MKSSRLIVTSRTITRRVAVPIPRMGSFNSAPKINNVDSQDDGLELPKGLNASELLQHVKNLRGDNFPPLLTRYFLKPLPQLSAQLAGTDITDGLRYLQLNSVSRVCSAPLSTSPNHFRLLQWNILSQTLGQNNDGFVRCPEEALTWEHRKFLIVQEILQNNPDIVCLQEVDHFKFLQNILGSQNYEGIFFPKPDSPCLYIEENNGPDGCAIFFKRDKFELKSYETRILEVWRVQSNQVAIAANLYVKALGREICVCTTHLKARHGALLSKLRNEQGRDLLRFVRNVAGEKRPVILCGDFNAEPIEPVYATMLSCEKMNFSSAYADIRRKGLTTTTIGEVVDENSTNSKNSDEKQTEAAVASALSLTSSSSSSMEVVDNENGDGVGVGVGDDYVQNSIQNEPPYTTWKIREDGEECHTIDYVFYAKDKFKVLNCLDFPPGEEIGKNRTPSFQYPSDHFSLVCDFEINEDESTPTKNLGSKS